MLEPAPLILGSLVALAPCVSSQDEWVCLHGTPPDVGGHSYERLASAYLQGQSFRLLPATASVERSTSRLVIGRPDDNRALAEILAAHGVEVGADRLALQGHDFGPGAGLVMVGDDPDGEGRFLLFTGLDDAGVLASFTTSPDLGREGWVRIRGRKVDARGALTRPIDTSQPRVVRLDQDARHFLERFRGVADPETELRLARSFEGHGFVFERAGFEGARGYAAWLLREGDTAAASVERAFRRRDPAAELQAAYERVAARLGAPEGARPVYYLLLGPPGGTNARTFDSDPVTGRPQVLLNLGALAREEHFEVAALHETVHVLHPGVRRTLGEKAVGEGVATYVSQSLAPDIELHQHLFWSRDELAAAERAGDRLIEAVLSRASATDPETTSPWLVLGNRPAAIPEAPSRAAYWVGWLAAKTWTEDGGHSLAELVRASPAEVLDALR